MKQLLVIFTFLSLTTQAQNLLLDGGFEQCNPDFNCDWKVIAGTPDFFGKGFDTLYNEYMLNEENMARSGRCYLGYFISYKSEFILGKLTAPLVADKEYYIEMYVQKSSHDDQHGILREISAQFTSEVPEVSPKYRTINGRFVSLRGQQEWLSEEDRWQLVAGKYVAKGGELYLLLGNFAGANLDLTKSGSMEKIFYYYFDDIAVLPATRFFENTATGSTIVVENILFETDKATLLPSSFSVLNQLVEDLKKQLNISLEIRGHTDNKGTAAANLQLSENRAKAVFEYLVENGIAANRLTFKGFGETMPMADNKTDAGRAQNRRVELRIVKQ